jgi:hypothetical protein
VAAILLGRQALERRSVVQVLQQALHRMLGQVFISHIHRHSMLGSTLPAPGSPAVGQRTLASSAEATTLDAMKERGLRSP